MTGPGLAMSAAARARESAAALRERRLAGPRVGVVLGSGLGAAAAAVEVTVEVAGGEVPHLAPPGAPRHAARVLGGDLGGVPVAIFQGRLHVYEGYATADVAFPVRVLRALGAETIVLTNAAGGIDPLLEVGDLMLIDDHLNLMGDNPLRGPNEDELGPRFPDLSRVYDADLLAAAEEAALAERIRVRRGVYAAVPGPSLETRAEYRFLRTAGADAVGMSTVPEAIVAVHAGLRVLGVSVITERCLPDALEPVRLADILRTAAEAAPRLGRLLQRMAREGAFDSLASARAGAETP